MALAATDKFTCRDKAAVLWSVIPPPHHLPRSRCKSACSPAERGSVSVRRSTAKNGQSLIFAARKLRGASFPVAIRRPPDKNSLDRAFWRSGGAPLGEPWPRAAADLCERASPRRYRTVPRRRTIPLTVVCCPWWAEEKRQCRTHETGVAAGGPRPPTAARSATSSTSTRTPSVIGATSALRLKLTTNCRRGTLTDTTGAT